MGELSQDRIDKYFDIKRDVTMPCWCNACLVGKNEEDMPPDPLYCQSCFTLLTDEAKLMGTKKPSWVPRIGSPVPLVDAQGTLQLDFKRYILITDEIVHIDNVTDNSSYVCKVCNATFYAKRKDAKYCSSKCRVSTHRQNKYAKKSKLAAVH